MRSTVLLAPCLALATLVACDGQTQTPSSEMRMSVLDEVVDQLSSDPGRESADWADLCDLEVPACAWWAAADADEPEREALMEQWLTETDEPVHLFKSKRKKCEESGGTWVKRDGMAGFCFKTLEPDPSPPLEPMPLDE